MSSFPKKIIGLDNPDKTFHEEWSKSRDLLNFPHPFRAVMLGTPNCGKGNFIKNIIIRAKPEFEEIYCIHCDAEYTKEWEDIGAVMLDEIPDPKAWEGKVKTLVVIDDYELQGLSKIQKHNLDRLFGFVSTHKNISVCLALQDAFSVPPIVRRCSNIFVLWKVADLDSMSRIARKVSVPVKVFNQIFKNHMPNVHDSLTVDMTSKSPCVLRKNGYERIEIKK
tara:strand:+ start:2176 stop:2841 length:666 start_codon:yes stop_codon:yes gene_type:complete